MPNFTTASTTPHTLRHDQGTRKLVDSEIAVTEDDTLNEMINDCALNPGYRMSDARSGAKGRVSFLSLFLDPLIQEKMPKKRVSQRKRLIDGRKRELKVRQWILTFCFGSSCFSLPSYRTFCLKSNCKVFFLVVSFENKNGQQHPVVKRSCSCCSCSDRHGKL